MPEKPTKVVIDKDENGVTWLRASPVNLVVSVSDKKIYVWTCEKGVNEGNNIFKMKIVKGKDDKWNLEDLKYAEFKKEEA